MERSLPAPRAGAAGEVPGLFPRTCSEQVTAAGGEGLRPVSLAVSALPSHGPAYSEPWLFTHTQAVENGPYIE